MFELLASQPFPQGSVAGCQPDQQLHMSSYMHGRRRVSTASEGKQAARQAALYTRDVTVLLAHAVFRLQDAYR